MRCLSILRSRITRLIFLLAALAAVPGCGNSHTQTSASTGTAVIQFTDLPFADLDSLELTITRILLFPAGDGAPVEVFPSSAGAGTTVTVDLVSLDGRTSLVGISDVPAGEFSAAEITFTGATATSGTPPVPQDVAPAAGSFRIDFVEPRVVSANQMAPFLLDFDGEASAVSGGPSAVNFIPTVFEIGGDDGSLVIAVRGEVVEVGADRFTVDFDDRTNGAKAIGRLPVILGIDSLFLVDGVGFAGPSGLSQIAPGDRVEVTGRLGPAGIEATQVTADRITDLNAKRTVRLRGTIIGVSPLLLLVRSIERDQQGIVQPGGTVTVTLDSSTSFLRQTGTGPIGASSLFVGQQVEVVGRLIGTEVTTSLVVLQAGRVTGTLSSIDLSRNTAALALTELNGPLAPGLPTEATLGLFSTEGFVGGTLPFPLTDFTSGQPVLATGFFIQPPDNIGPPVFSVDTLSLEQLDDFDALPLSADRGAGTFTAGTRGTTVTVTLSDSTRLAVRQTTLPDRIFNVGRDEFLDDLAHIVGTVSVRGFLSGAQIAATRAVMAITPPGP